MILGDLLNWEQELFSPLIQRAMAFISSTELKDLEAGRYEIDGDNMFAMIQEFITVDKTQRKAECHSRYVDLQYLIEGDETIFVARPSAQNVVVENELENKDYALFDEVHNESPIHLQPGMFVILFPSDIHRPGCSVSESRNIKKAVIKIRMDALRGADQ